MLRKVMAPELVSSWKSFNGYQKVFKYNSTALNSETTFGVYVPEHKEGEKLPTLFYLSGLTCTHANFMEKSGFQKYASEYRLIVVHPDTSPRGKDVADSERWDLGQGAGFYLNATQEPWKAHYQMETFVTQELPGLAAEVAPVDRERIGVFGHSAGGHGAITLGLRHPDLFKSISAFSPIAHPTNCDWGRRIFTAYLGDDEGTWVGHDSSIAVKKYEGPKRRILVDQGSKDEWIEQLWPHSLTSTQKVHIDTRFREGYDHSYYFVATFIGEHFAHHHDFLKQ